MFLLLLPKSTWNIVPRLPTTANDHLASSCHPAVGGKAVDEVDGAGTVSVARLAWSTGGIGGTVFALLSESEVLFWYASSVF